MDLVVFLSTPGANKTKQTNNKQQTDKHGQDKQHGQHNKPVHHESHATRTYDLEAVLWGTGPGLQRA